RLSGMTLAQDEERQSRMNTYLGVGLGLLAFGAYRAGAFRGISERFFNAASQIRGIGVRALYQGATDWLAESPALPGIRLGKFNWFRVGKESINLGWLEMRWGRPTEAFRGLMRNVSEAHSRIAQEVSQPLHGQSSTLERFILN